MRKIVRCGMAYVNIVSAHGCVCMCVCVCVCVCIHTLSELLQ